MFKLGISYLVFNGEELLEFAIKSIRSQVDFISVVYQNTSFNGIKYSPWPIISKIKEIDEFVFFEPNIDLSHKTNETIGRNLGLEASIKAKCTHHISADVDEFYKADELAIAKKSIGDHDCSVIELVNYYKHPQYLITPIQRQKVSFIHKVEFKYDKNYDFPYKVDPTRKVTSKNVKNITDVTMHHMSYIRRDIRAKLSCSPNALFYNINKFVEDFDKYKLGGRLNIAPDFMNRKTVLVENIFNIQGGIWEPHQLQVKEQECQIK